MQDWQCSQSDHEAIQWVGVQVLVPRKARIGGTQARWSLLQRRMGGWRREMTNYDCNSPQKMGWTSLFVRVRGMLVQRVLLDEIPLMPRWIRVLMAHRSCACVLSPSVASKMKESVSEALMRARS